MVLLNEIMIGIEFDRSCSYTYTDVSVPSGNPKGLGRSAISRMSLTSSGQDSNWLVLKVHSENWIIETFTLFKKHILKIETLKKIHDTLSRIGSLENTFTQVYVYDLEETHHYDHHNTFWDRAKPQQNNNSHCLKQFYVSLNDEYQKSYSGTRRSLGSWTVLPSFFFSFLTY